MRLLAFILLFLVFGLCKGVAQTLEGRIIDEEGQPMPLASLLIKSLDKPEQISEFTQAREGNYRYRLRKAYTAIILEVRVMGYLTVQDTLRNLQQGQTYTQSFSLKPDIKDLEEIVVEAEKPPIQEKKDTVVYDVEAFSDGTERKVQDIIKKLPGMEVNEKSGEIKYKGKSVETVMLDGDNLFDYNYSIGTKNINISMVEQIEAIENYTENPLLKDIEQGGKVALNLKLKKGKADFSGSTDAGGGLFDGGDPALMINSTLLGITKSYKSFANLSYNNIGVNHSPFDYFGGSNSIERIKEQDFYAPKVIPESFPADNLDERRASVNDAWFGSYNAIFRVKKRLSIKTNLYYLRDELFSRQIQESQNNISGQQFTTSDERTTFKRPRQYRGDLELKYNTSDNSLLEYDLRLRQENIRTPFTVLSNEANNFESNLRTRDFYLKQKLLWTKKLSKTKALQLSLNHAYNDVPQTFRINPSTLQISPNTEQDVQESNFQKQYLDSKATLLGSNKLGRYAISLGAMIDENPFASRLFGVSSNLAQPNEESTNDTRYRSESLYQRSSYSINLGRWQLSPSYSLTLLQQNLRNFEEMRQQTQTDLLIEPSFYISYKVSNISAISGNISYGQSPNNPLYSFENTILTGNRLLIRNTPSLDLQRGLSSSLYYRISNMYEQFTFSMGASYQQNTGNIFSNFEIGENLTRLAYFFLDESTDNLRFSLSTSKFIYKWAINLELNSSYAISNYQNIVNNSDLRNNRSNRYRLDFSVRTGFDFPINFNNTFGFDESRSQSDKGQSFINTSIYNNAEIHFRFSNAWVMSWRSDYYLPNVEQSNQDFMFLDTSLRFSPKDKRYEVELVLNNILNIDDFREVSTSDYATLVFQSNLLPRHFLLSFSLEF